MVAKRDGGKVAEEVVDRIGDYIQEYAPELAPIYSTLLPFADLFGSTSAGPQKNAKDYDPNEPPYIELHIDDPRYNGSDTDGVQLYCRITAGSIVLQWHCVAKSGDYYMDESEIELAALWDYLRQLPRPYDSFCKGGE